VDDLEEDPELIKERYAFMNQKHTKKDYANLRELTIGDIFDSVQVAPKKVMYQEDKINY